MLTDFQKTVLTRVDKVPKGKVTTYSQIAKSIGKPKAFRAVGTAVGKNPNLIKTPCHRVVKTDGMIGEYSGKGGQRGKIKLLKSEGIEIENEKKVNLDKVLFKFR